MKYFNTNSYSYNGFWAIILPCEDELYLELKVKVR